jgi:hypothetical protein
MTPLVANGFAVSLLVVARPIRAVKQVVNFGRHDEIGSRAVP